MDWQELIPRIAHDARALVRQSLLNAELLERSLEPVLSNDASTEVSARLRAIVDSNMDLNHFLVRLVALSDADRPPAQSSSPAAQPVELEMAVLEAWLACRDAVQRAGAELEIKELPVCTVPPKTQTVLRELIDNSLRYGDPSRSQRLVIEAESDGMRVLVRVVDNGTGVAPAYVHKLFQPLQRLDGVRSGFGLGLAISRAIINGAGGSIYTEPAETGARFVFVLPRQPASVNGH